MLHSSDITCTDHFCGAGGSSTGLKNAGIRVVHAANHWQLAIDSHSSNHPDVDHICADLVQIDPIHFPNTTIAWFSPECTTHSPSKSLKQASGQLDLWGREDAVDPSVVRSRLTTSEVWRFIDHHRYQTAIVENVVELSDWGQYRKGDLFEEWIKEICKLGYHNQILCYNSMFGYPEPTPQSRDRLFVVFNRIGNPAPNLNFCPPAVCQEHGEVEAVQDWAMKHHFRRIGKYGRRRQYIYVCPHCGVEVLPLMRPARDALDLSLPMVKIGDRARHKLKALSPNTLKRIQAGLERFTLPWIEARMSGLHSLEQPSAFISTARNHNLATSLEEPTAVVQTGRHHALVQPPAFISSYYGKGGGALISHPSPTMTTVQGQALISPAMSALVQECGYRMLVAHEAKLLQGFPTAYIILGGSSEQFKQVGNAVPPVFAQMIGKAVVEALA